MSVTKPEEIKFSDIPMNTIIKQPIIVIKSETHSELVGYEYLQKWGKNYCKFIRTEKLDNYSEWLETLEPETNANILFHPDEPFEKSWLMEKII